jgi:Tyrosine phosphatase family
MRGALHVGMNIPLPDAGSSCIHLFDFRRPNEIRGPSANTPNLCRHWWPLHDPEWRSGERTSRFYVESSLRLASQIGPAVTDAMHLLASGEGLFVGCRLGKDRTGLMVLLLGRLLGLDDDTLIADYVRTADEFSTHSEWVERYAHARSEDSDTLMVRLCPPRDIPIGILAELPSSHNELCDSLRLGRDLVEKASWAVVARPCMIPD